MSGVQSSLFWFPGPGGRGSRLVGLWVRKTGSCQGYHDGTLRDDWLRVARTTQQSNGHAAAVVGWTCLWGLGGCVSIPSIASRRAHNRCASQYVVIVIVVVVVVVAVVAGPVLVVRQHRQTRASSARAGSVKDRGSWSVDAARYKCREVGGRKSRMGHGEGCWSHRADRGLDLAQPAVCLVDRGPLAGARYQDGRAGPWCAPSLEFVSVGDG